MASHSETVLSTAKSYFESNRFSQARKCFQQLLDSYEIDTNAHNDCLFNIASCLASEANFEAALDILEQLQPAASNDLLYSRALCQYMLNDFVASQQLVDQLLDNCRKMLPDVAMLGPEVGLVSDELPSQAITSSCLIEAINLRFAILYSQTVVGYQAGQLETKLTNALSFMGSLGALDCVSLHNQAISRQRLEPAASVDKLLHLVQLSQRDESFASLIPSSTLKNLLVICTKHTSFREPGLKVFKEHKQQLVDICTSKEEVELLEILLSNTSGQDQEAHYWKLDQLSDRLMKQIVALDDSKANQSIDIVDLLSSVVSYQGLILWQSNQYERLEQLLLKFESHLKKTDTWTINMANTLLMMDEKIDLAGQLYESLLTKSTSPTGENLLLLEPMILANLCVAYVLTGRNGDAEQLMKEVELDETKFGDRSDNSLQALKPEVVRNVRPHTTIINLVIGTLYCARNNYEFGLPKILKSLQPVERKVQQNTWFHAKRCITWLLMLHCKQMIYLGDEIFDEMIGFLIECEKYGLLELTRDHLDYRTDSDRDSNNNNNNSNSSIDINRNKVSTVEESTGQINGNNTIAYEARYLRSIMLKVVHD